MATARNPHPRRRERDPPLAWPRPSERTMSAVCRHPFVDLDDPAIEELRKDDVLARRALQDDSDTRFVVDRETREDDERAPSAAPLRFRAEAAFRRYRRSPSSRILILYDGGRGLHRREPQDSSDARDRSVFVSLWALGQELRRQEPTRPVAGRRCP